MTGEQDAFFAFFHLFPFYGLFGINFSDIKCHLFKCHPRPHTACNWKQGWDLHHSAHQLSNNIEHDGLPRLTAQQLRRTSYCIIDMMLDGLQRICQIWANLLFKNGLSVVKRPVDIKILCSFTCHTNSFLQLINLICRIEFVVLVMVGTQSSAS